MNRAKIYFLTIVFILISSISVSVARAEAEKLGYVDLSRLFDSYNKTQDYDKRLDASQKVKESQREKKVNEIKQLQGRLNILKAAAREKQENLIDQKTIALQEFDRQLQLEMRQDRDEKIRVLLKDIERAVRDFAQKNNYAFIFNDRVLVYGNEVNDVTDEILKILNK